MTSGRRLGLLLAALDSLSLLLAFNLIGWMRGFLDPTAPIILPLVIPIVLLGLALYLIDGYRPRTDMLSLDYASTHTIALIVAMLTTLLITFVLIPIDLPLRPSRMAMALSFAVVTVVSISYRRWLYTFRASRHQHRALVFLGDEESHETFDAECTRIGMKQTIIHANAGSPESLDKVITQMSSGQLAVEAVILRESFNRISPEASQKLVDLYFGGIPTYTLELFHQVYWRKIPLYRINQTWLFQEGFRVAREPVFERIKRLSDICFSLVGLTIAAPVLTVAALAIWLDDRGPILFRQARIGCQRKPFTLFKLRTMRTTQNGDRYTREGDSRITRIGKFLRASRIDEFPQLLNVLRGEMSLIGPRAEWDLLVHDYETKIPCYHFRHLVRPGITGWAQVNYPYGANLDDTLRKLEYDLYYIRYFSFRLDASIVLKTVHVMLFGKGR